MKRKVLHLRSSGGLLGAENVVIELCKRAQENNYTAVAGALKNINDPYPEFIEAAQKLSLATVVFPCKNQFDVRCSRTIKKYVENNGVDIIHAHGYKEDFYCLLSNVKIPKIATNHLWKKTNFKDRFYCYLDSILLKRFDSVVGVSGEIVRELHDNKITKAIKIDNGIDIKRFLIDRKSDALLAQFGIAPHLNVIGMISSITPEKGHEIALRAFADVLKKHAHVKLLIVGDGIQLPAMKKLSAALNIENHVVFTGKRTDIPELLSIMDIFLMTSLAEGLPMALLEAMAAGKAAIATMVGEIPEVVSDGKNGFLIKPGDISGTGNAIIRLLSMDARSRKNIGICATDTVAQRYSSESMAKKYFEVYDSLLVKFR